MTPAKTLEAILAGSRNVRFADLERLALAFGFELDRQTGSQRIYVHPERRCRLNLQPQGGQAKPYQMRQLMMLVEEHGLRIEE